MFCNASCCSVPKILPESMIPSWLHPRINFPRRSGTLGPITEAKVGWDAVDCPLHSKNPAGGVAAANQSTEPTGTEATLPWEGSIQY